MELELQPLANKPFNQESSKLLVEESFSAADDTTANRNSPGSQSPFGDTRWSLCSNAYSGWQVGIAICFLFTVLALLLNLSITIWVYTSLRLKDNIGTANEGNCGRIETQSRWIHLGNSLVL